VANTPRVGSVFQQGSGPALVLLPGIQGRWEYTRPTVDALARHFRVLTFSLGGPPPDGRDIFSTEVDRLSSVLDDHGIERAILCGVSYGGLVAARFAAMHPERTTALVMASTPGPEWHLRPRHLFYARWPWLFGPLFLLETPFRLRVELKTALPGFTDRRTFMRWQVRTILSAPVSLFQMAARARELPIPGIVSDCSRIEAPTLIVTGEQRLDRVVPADGTAAYARLIRGATRVVLERTGHQGTITRPAEFAAMVHAFVDETGVASGFSRTTSHSEVA
jgi:pimeloyl-ACP methyl ester carboxylesterase